MRFIIMFVAAVCFLFYVFDKNVKLKLNKIAKNASTNNSETIYHTHLRIGEVIYKCVSYNIPSFWLISLNGFNLVFFVA